MDEANRDGPPLTKIVKYIIIISMSATQAGPRQQTDGGLVRLDGLAAPVRRIPNALARRFLQICTAALAETVEDADLTPLEFAIMAYLDKTTGEPDIDQSTLAARLGVDRNNTSLLVSSLESKALLERRVDGSDRRMRRVRLTRRGERLFAKLHPKALEGQQRILDVLELGEGEMLLDLLVRVIEGNRALARPGAGRRRRTITSPPTT